MRLNGNELDQADAVEPTVSVMDLGVECMKNINPESWSSLKFAMEVVREVEEEGVFSGSDEDDDVDILDETGEWHNVQQSQQFM
jgi:hypothetical protein